MFMYKWRWTLVCELIFLKNNTEENSGFQKKTNPIRSDGQIKSLKLQNTKFVSSSGAGFQVLIPGSFFMVFQETDILFC